MPKKRSDDPLPPRARRMSQEDQERIKASRAAEDDAEPGAVVKKTTGPIPAQPGSVVADMVPVDPERVVADMVPADPERVVADMVPVDPERVVADMVRAEAVQQAREREERERPVRDLA